MVTNKKENLPFRLSFPINPNPIFIFLAKKNVNNEKELFKFRISSVLDYSQNAVLFSSG